MTLDEAIKYVEEVAELNEWFDKNFLENMQCKERAEEYRQLAEWLKELKQLREQTKRIPDKPDTWSIKDIADVLARHGLIVEQGSKIGHCKECKYFERDSVANVDGIPLIIAHEICSKWGAGCKTKEDGYCFLFEPQEGG